MYSVSGRVVAASSVVSEGGATTVQFRFLKNKKMVNGGVNFPLNVSIHENNNRLDR